MTYDRVMRLRHIWLLAAAWVLAQPLLAADARLGPETPLSRQVNLEPVPYNVHGLASNGRGALALLNRTYGLLGRNWTTALKLVPIAADGQSPNPAGRNLALYSTVPWRSGKALLATDGNDYLVVWVNGDIVYSQAVDEGGQPLRPPRIAASDWQSPYLVALVWDGFAYVLIDRSRTLVLDRQGGPVRKLGSLTPGEILWVGGQNGQLIAAASVWDGRSYARVIVRLNQFGARESVTLSPELRSSAKYAAAGSTDRMLFVDRDSGGLAITNFDGTVLARGRVSFGTKVDNIAAWWDGIQFVVTWLDRSTGGTMASRITPSGVNRDPQPLVLNGIGSSPLFAQTSSGQIVLSTTTTVIAHALQGPDALASQLGPGNVVAHSGREETQVQIANAGGHRIAVSCNRFGGEWWQWQVSIAFDGESQPLPDGYVACLYAPPSIAAGDRNYLIAAANYNGDLLVWRADFRGRIRNDDPLTVELPQDFAHQDGPYVMHHRGSFVVSFAARSTGSPDQTYPLLSFNVTDAPSAITNAATVRGEPYVFRPLSPGNETLLPFALLDWYGWIDGGVYYFWDFRFAQNGMDTSSLFRGYDADREPFNRKGFAAAATNGERVTYVWNVSESKLLVAQASLDGKPIDLPRVIATENAAEVEIVWNGNEYVVAWSGTTRGEPFPRIRAIRLDASATPIDAAPFFVSPPGATRDRPSISVTQSGVEIAYSRIEDTNGGAPRAFVRSLDRLPPVTGRRRAAGR